MIDPDRNYITHTVLGLCSLEQYTAAVTREGESVVPKPVLWDLSNAQFDQDPVTLAEALTKLVRDKKDSMSFEKRGFLASSEHRSALIEAILSQSKVHWPWAVFHDVSKVARWFNS